MSFNQGKWVDIHRTLGFRHDFTTRGVANWMRSGFDLYSFGNTVTWLTRYGEEDLVLAIQLMEND